MTTGKSMSAQQHHDAGLFRTERLAHAGRMTSQEVVLQFADLAGRNAHVHEMAEARVDAIGGVVFREGGQDNLSRGSHAGGRLCSQGRTRRPLRDPLHLAEQDPAHEGPILAPF